MRWQTLVKPFGSSARPGESHVTSQPSIMLHGMLEGCGNACVGLPNHWPLQGLSLYNTWDCHSAEAFYLCSGAGRAPAGAQKPCSSLCSRRLILRALLSRLARPFPPAPGCNEPCLAAKEVLGPLPAGAVTVGLEHVPV